MIRITYLVSLLIPFVTTSLLAAETFEEMQQKLLATYAKLNSFTADIAMKTELYTGQNVQKQESTGTIEWMRDGDSAKTRTEVNGTTIRTGMGGEMKWAESSIYLADGAFFYTVMRRNNEVVAFKTDLSPAMTLDLAFIFKQLHETSDLKRLDDDTVDGRACYVIEARPKGALPGSTARQVVYFDKATAISLKAVSTDEAGRIVQEATTTKIKAYVPIPAERFVFTPPEGVTVVDQTSRKSNPGE